jgi:hypothetical protein
MTPDMFNALMTTVQILGMMAFFAFLMWLGNR